MILYPSPSKAFPYSTRDFDTFASQHPEVTAWQDTLTVLVSNFASTGVKGRQVGSDTLDAVRKVLSAYQQNAISQNGVDVWEYLWLLKRATQDALTAYRVGSSSPNAPAGAGTLTLTLTAQASLAVAALKAWVPEAPSKLQQPAPGNLNGLLDSIATGTVLTQEGQPQPNTGGFYQVHIIQPGDTLRSLAARYLGDSSLWTEIRDLNQLRYPYISSSLQDQLGPPEAEWILQTVQVGTSASLLWAPPITAGATSAVLPGPTIRPGDVIVLSQANTFVQESLTAKSVSGNTVTFSTVVQNSYPSGSRAFLCPPQGDTYYTVLGYGQAIKIPSAQPASVSAVASPDLILGTDLAVNQRGDMYLTSIGDLATVSGVANIQQAIQNRIATNVGSLPLWPTYGSNLATLMSYGPSYATLIALDIQASLLQDPRIAAVRNPSFSTSSDPATGAQVFTFTADIQLQGFDSESLLPISVPVSA